MSADLNTLIKLTQKGDENAFDELYYATKDRVFYTILSILKDYHLSEDIMQNTYIKIRQGINNYKDNNPFGWIITIARNLAINEYNKRQKELTIDTTQSEFLFPSYEIDASLSNIDRIMKDLDVEEREIVSLYIVSGFKHREIAKITGKPLGTVLWKYRKALKTLKINLEKEEQQ